MATFLYSRFGIGLVAGGKVLSLGLIAYMAISTRIKISTSANEMISYFCDPKKKQTLVARDKIYFASDFHLGFPTIEQGRHREKKIVAWLDTIKSDAKELYLLGDIFDFWFEYKWVVPRGYIRFLGKLAELSDNGIKIYLFNGNHDEWYFDYLPKEIGIEVHSDPLTKTYNGKRFFLHHGHGLGNYDRGMNLIKWVFRNKFLQWCFARVHPNTSFGFAHRCSIISRKTKQYDSSHYLGEEKEWLIRYAKEILEKEPYDYFIFGHRHVAMEMDLGKSATYVNLGNWLSGFTFAVFDGESVQLRKFEDDESTPIYNSPYIVQ